ncbi:hypothetical protein Hanom_Chr12g01136821 [Helianthus anomalus]
MFLLQHSPMFPPRFVVLRGRGVTHELLQDDLHLEESDSSHILHHRGLQHKL